MGQASSTISTAEKLRRGKEIRNNHSSNFVSGLWPFVAFLTFIPLCFCPKASLAHSIGETSTDNCASHDRPFSASRKRTTLGGLLNLRHGFTNKKEGPTGPQMISGVSVRASRRLFRSSLRYSYSLKLPIVTRNLGDLTRRQVRIYSPRENSSDRTDVIFQSFGNLKVSCAEPLRSTRKAVISVMLLTVSTKMGSTSRLSRLCDVAMSLMSSFATSTGMYLCWGCSDCSANIEQMAPETRGPYSASLLTALQHLVKTRAYLLGTKINHH